MVGPVEYLGLKYEYSPNGAKSYLIVKEAYVDEVNQMIEGINITITTSRPDILAQHWDRLSSRKRSSGKSVSVVQ